MKGLSVKKIAALAAGAAILGASVALADVTFGNTQIVNQNGQPVVKVVVGQKAAASDGVVAANIAAVIGNKAYSKQTISATLSGTATCTVSGGSAAGSCPVSEEKVTLEVTLPGVVSGSANFKTYINDYVDKYTEDRMTAPRGSANNYSTTTEIKPTFDRDPTLNGNVANTAPEVGDPGSANGAAHGRKITGGEFPSLATATIRDTQASGSKSYTEEQTLWVYGKTVYDETLKAVVTTDPNVAYKVDFTHDQYGLPQYSCGNYGSSSCSDNDLTSRHRVSIKFLGEDWIISEMSPPDGMSDFNPSTYVAKTGTGSSISLAKESAYGVVHIGENLSAGAYGVKLADISLATGTANVHAAAIEIYDANGVLAKETQVDPDSTYTWNAPDGTKLKIHIYKTQPGYTLASKWAEMAIYSNEMTLTHNTKIDNVDNPLWTPYLYWSNNPNNSNVTTLKSIVLMRSRTHPDTMGVKLNKGDSIPVITTPQKFLMKFDGLNLESADYDGLVFSVTGSGTSISYGPSGCASSTTLASTFLQVSTGVTNAFTVDGSPVSNFYIDLNNVNEDGAMVFYQASGQNCFYNKTFANTTTTELASYNLGDGVMQSIALNRVDKNGENGNVSLYLEEKASATTDDKDRFYLELDNITDSAWAFTGTSTQDKIKYRYAVSTGPACTASTCTTNLKAIDPGYVSERGSMFYALDSKSATLKVAKKVAEANYYVSLVGAAASGATEITLAEGEEQTLAGGVKIKAKSITEKVGSCTVGAGGNCNVDMSPVSAVLNTGEASVNAITSYKVGDLVVMDNQAGGAAVLISVGGPMVNEVTKQALGSSSTLTKSGDVVVKEVGNVIVVAGYTAQDTTDAGKQFVNSLQSS